MAPSNSTIPKKRQNSKNHGGTATYEYKNKYIAKYIRNTLLSHKQTLGKKGLSPSQLNIVLNFHTFCFFTSLNNFSSKMVI